MNCSDINIDKTFIIEPVTVSSTPTYTACTGLYTNVVISCDNDNEIDLSRSGLTEFNTAISATTVYGVDVNEVKGGGWVIPTLDEIYMNPLDWVDKLKPGQYVLTTPYTVTGATSGTSQFYELVDENQFDNPSGWKRVVDNDTTISSYLSGNTLVFNTIYSNDVYSVDLSKLDNEIHQTMSVISDGQINLTYNTPIVTNADNLKLYLNGVLQDNNIDYSVVGLSITWLNLDYGLATTDIIKIIYI